MNTDEWEKIYRPSSTLIIAAKSTYNEDRCNYRILLTKRSASIAFAPNHHVFPGGVFYPNADEDIEWLKYFKTFDICKEDLGQLCLHHPGNRPRPLMTNGVNFSRDISLRITAIREAFEEVGLLLCINRNKKKGLENFIVNFDRLTWQRRVHNNAMEFLNLCKYLDCIPDLWSLHEWNIWRSPPSSLKRYDTVIYVVTLNYQPELILEPTEVEKELWATPSESLLLFKNRKIWLAPMQFYEISRISKLTEWTKFRECVNNRRYRCSSLIMMPAYFECTDYLVGLLPGDDFYPSNILTHTATIRIPLSDAEFKAKTKHIHRITFYDMYNLSLTSNVTPVDNHLTSSLKLNSNSKL